MKLDSEGAEYETLGAGIPADMMCRYKVDSAFFEAHGWGKVDNHWKGPRGSTEITRRIADHACERGLPTLVLPLDDESYVHDVDDDFAR